MFTNQNQEKKTVDSIISIINSRKQAIDIQGLNRAAKGYFISRIYQKLAKPVVIIMESNKDVENCILDISFFTKNVPVYYFISYNIQPFKLISYHNQTAAERIRVLYQLVNYNTAPIILTTIEALQQRLIPKQQLCDYAELIMEGEEINRDVLIEKLISGGYVRSTIVEEPGDFSLRGGILDIFSPLYQEPLRIEMFGDMVESLRIFSASTQRTIQPIQEAVILPAKETILKRFEINQIIQRLQKQASDSNIPANKVKDIIEQIKNKGIFPGIESLTPLIYSKMDTFFDYLPEDSVFILSEPANIENTAFGLHKQALENYNKACEKEKLCVQPEKLYLNWSEIKAVFEQKKPLNLTTFASDIEFQDRNIHFSFSIKDNSILQTTLKHNKNKDHLFLPLAKHINKQKELNYASLLICNTKANANRLYSLLLPYGIDAAIIEGFPDVNRAKGIVYICQGQISSGFTWPDEFLFIITENEVFGLKKTRKKISRQKIKTHLLTFEDLNVGELVVHDEHGIGRYEGLTKLQLTPGCGGANDFLIILYKDGDRLYLPVDRMNVVQKYMGVDGIEPVLDKMGGASWAKIQAKVKKSVEKIAGGLLKIYAERKIKQGYEFKAPEHDIQEFEAGFIYEETPDQLKAIEDVFNDMQKPLPMDRLICGDVGYGKTEVALRASFMAVNSDKQVAVLVPTTVLAEQHFETFSQRYENYPINIACLSRFRSAKEQRSIIENLKNGQVDIIIGTHRLIQKDIKFKDLGLIILDEEQRFGVKHKEKLKKLRSTVDVLALTATPIPRTLHLSLMGIRDISIISTPPEQRYPIITYISEFDDSIISEAVKKELSRNGQIFFIHNNINTINKMASYIKDMVPKVRLAIAHGRMSEDELEKVMFQFMNKDIDMLICTTIVESGLDVPNANTILVNRADRFGLAQIYQLRGRVGRAGEQAYAYLFIPNESTLTKDAKKRLKVLMEHSDLGSGFQIAMSDLKIRGGGTILGASQSGHIAAVGYDMFLKLMEDAMSHLKGQPVAKALEPEINIYLSAFISEDYIPDISQRLTAYRRLSKMSDLKEISEFKAELLDRFGSLPNETANLLLKIMLKILSRKAGVKRLDLTENKLILYFSEAHQRNPFGIIDMIISQKNKFKFTKDNILKANLSGTGAVLSQTKNILKEIIQRVNN